MSNRQLFAVNENMFKQQFNLMFTCRIFTVIIFYIALLKTVSIKIDIIIAQKNEKIQSAKCELLH